MDVYGSFRLFGSLTRCVRMLRFGIMACAQVALLWQSGIIDGAESVTVELRNGKQIRATSIEIDPHSPDRILVANLAERIQIWRVVSWSRVRQIAAPSALLKGLVIPEDVRVVQTDGQSELPRELVLNLTDTNHNENSQRIQDFVGRKPGDGRLPAPPAPIPDPDGILPILDSNHLRIVQDGIPIRALDRSYALPELVPNGIVLSNCVPCPVYDPGVVVGIRDEFPSGASLRPVNQPDPREIVVAARAFNRRGLADWNSLEVSIQGKTSAGQACLVRGSVKCSLWVRQAQLIRAYGEIYFEEARDVVRVQSWSQFLDGSEADANGIQKIVLALPPRPSDQNLSWGEYGLLNVDLDIPGQGRLSTSSDAIPLRQVGSIRSRSVVNFGTSHLPTESTSEGTLDAGIWPQPASGARPDRRIFSTNP